MRAVVSALIATIMGGAVACGTSPPAQSGTRSPPASTAANLPPIVARIREHQARLRDGTKTSIYAPEGWRSWDLSPLIGLDRATLIAAFGQPSDACPAANGIPCIFGVDLVYLMYRLGEYDLGGGPHIAIELDKHGRCSHVRWFITK